MNLRIGFRCWFQHTDGRIIEGIYRARRKVEQMTAFTRVAGGFEETVTTFTVPKSVRIHRGSAPPADVLGAVEPRAVK